MEIKMEEQPIVASQEESGDKTEQILEGRVIVDPDNDQVAPLEASPVKAMVKLTGTGSPVNRPGLDLVAVLDISPSMETDHKLDKLIMAMRFVIRKLTPNDRLSIVTFDGIVETVCGLRLMSNEFKTLIESKDLRSYMSPGGGTKIDEGLRTGLRVLNTRRFTADRVGAIMLMSDGEENLGSDASSVRDNIDTVPVFTFGFGTSEGAQVLRNVAKNSQDGTFSDVSVLDDLNPAFAQILAGLVTVIAQDVQLTLKAINSTKFKDVSAGSYAKNPNTETLVTVLFGNLYDKEMRNVMVELLLPATTKQGDIAVVDITCTYSAGGKSTPPQRFLLYVERTRKPIPREKEEVTLEKKRLETTKLMIEARENAEKDKMAEAKKKLNEAQQLLRGVGDEFNPLIKTLKYELKHLLSSLRSPENFADKGLPFALSSELCHERQRFAARGDHSQVRLFATPRMDEYLKQSVEFQKNPNIPLKTAEEDAKKEIADDPLGPFAGAITCHIRSAIQSLEAIAKIISANR